jgi:parvulin-like peptidyl-prolyl isomerase
VSTVLDDAIFSTQVGDLSDVLMDDDGFHIVRVLERKDAGHVSFVEAQVGIRDKIKQQRRDEKVREYLERLKRDTYVWNYFVDGASQQ